MNPELSIKLMPNGAVHVENWATLAEWEALTGKKLEITLRDGEGAVLGRWHDLDSPAIVEDKS